MRVHAPSGQPKTGSLTHAVPRVFRQPAPKIPRASYSARIDDIPRFYSSGDQRHLLPVAHADSYGADRAEQYNRCSALNSFARST